MVKMRMTKHRQRETVRERDQHHLPNIRVADLRHRTPRVLPHTTSPHQPFPALLAPLGCLARMRCCIKRTRLVRRVDASALNLALPFGEEAVDALQPVLQFPETRTRELEKGRRNTDKVRSIATRVRARNGREHRLDREAITALRGAMATRPIAARTMPRAGSRVREPR